MGGPQPQSLWLQQRLCSHPYVPRNTGHLPPNAVPIGDQLLLRNESIGTTFICLVFNGCKMAKAYWTVRPFGE